MRRVKNPGCEFDDIRSVDDSEQLLADPDHGVILARRNLLVALAVTGMTSMVACGGETTDDARRPGATTPVSGAAGAPGGGPLADGGNQAGSLDAAVPTGAGGTGAPDGSDLDAGQMPQLDAPPTDAADEDAAMDARDGDAPLDAADEDADAGPAVCGGCGGCGACGGCGP
jgi:hypothetical protein